MRGLVGVPVKQFEMPPWDLQEIAKEKMKTKGKKPSQMASGTSNRRNTLGL